MQPTSLTTLVAEQLTAAREAGSGRSARTVRGGEERALRQTLLALTAGHGLDDHESPGEATLQVLRGRVRLTTATDSCEATTGDQFDIPPERHGLDAIDDSAVLLTVVAGVGLVGGREELDVGPDLHIGTDADPRDVEQHHAEVQERARPDAGLVAVVDVQW